MNSIVNTSKILFVSKSSLLSPNNRISVTVESLCSENADIFADFLCKSINVTFKSSMFPNSLKLADATPLLKKGRKDLKENYRPVSILPTL